MQSSGGSADDAGAGQLGGTLGGRCVVIDTHYQVLGVTSTATTAQIKSAFRDLVMVVHPDRGGSAALFQRVSLAYEVLADPARRHSYNLFLSEGGTDSGHYHRRERHRRARAERECPRDRTAQRVNGHTRVPPWRTQDQRARRETEERGKQTATLGRRADCIRYLVGAGAASVVGFWVVQILWLVIDDDLDQVSDLLDLSWSSWWILTLAATNLALALRIRSCGGDGRQSANAALATVVCSGLLLAAFLVRGAGSDDLGVWPAAVGAGISAVNALRFRRVSSNLEDSSAEGV